MRELLTPERVVDVARSWIGTPYHHQASCKAVGADCLGLVRGIFRECLGFDIDIPANYSRDWAEASGIETMLHGARQHLAEVPMTDIAPGDVAIFRLRRGYVAKHAALIATPDTMIHAMEGCPVSEVDFSPWWRRHVAGVFRFPTPRNGA